MIDVVNRFKIALLCFVASAITASSALASTLLVTESGTFSASSPATAISSPSGAFSLSFDTASSPVVLGSSTNQFNVAYTNFSYKLNGVIDPAGVGSITFFDTAQGGLFSVCFQLPCPANGSSSSTLAFLGLQAYSGSVTAPTILAGSYVNTGSYATLNGSIYNFGTLSNVNITPVSATPEPSSFVLLGSGLLAVAGFARRRFI